MLGPVGRKGQGVELMSVKGQVLRAATANVVPYHGSGGVPVGQSGGAVHADM